MRRSRIPGRALVLTVTRKNKTPARSPRNPVPAALDGLSDAGGTVPAALSALDPAVKGEANTWLGYLVPLA